MVRSMSLSKWGPTDCKLETTLTEVDRSRPALRGLSQDNNAKFKCSAPFDSHQPLPINTAGCHRRSFLCPPNATFDSIALLAFLSCLEFLARQLIQSSPDGVRLPLAIEALSQ